MPAARVVLIHYGELALKGGNRKQFEKQLEQNVRIALRGLSVVTHRLYGRLLVTEKTDGALTDEVAIAERLSHVYGIAKFSCGYEIEGGYAEIEKAVVELLRDTPYRTFAVRTLRVDKQFPLTSEDVNRKLGAAILERYRSAVDLDNPELEVRCIISPDGHFVAWKWHNGAGGLPVGSSGVVFSLLSAGIDSPVASHRMMKRGSRVRYLHFHSYPITSRASIDQVKELVSVLQRYQPESQLYCVPFADAQKVIATQAPSMLRVVLYRRLMFQIAEALAVQQHAHGLVTGESLGQVASQTIENMTATSSDLTLPVFRPLVGFDKQEIMDEAKRIGTYDISIQPYEDCCSLLTPKRVETRARLHVVRDIQAKLPWNEMIQNALQQVEEFRV